MAKHSSRLEVWIRAYGIGRLSRVLGVHRTTVQTWVGSRKPATRPSKLNAKRIAEFSKAEPHEIGPLTLEEIV
jgi:hypothetical protein